MCLALERGKLVLVGFNIPKRHKDAVKEAEYL